MARNTKNTDELTAYTNELFREFQRWDYLYEHGGSDPFWPDGMGLNLVRNHIIYDKRKIDEFIKKESDEPTLFGVSYPEIYYRETPPEVPYEYMVKADEIRDKAAELLATCEKDPNFTWLRDHYSEVFPKGETRGTTAARIFPGQASGTMWFRKCIEEDDLVAMRRMISEPYEEKAKRWAETAAKWKAYLDADHSVEDHIATPSDYDEEMDCPDEGTGLDDDFEVQEEPEAPKRPSVDQLIKNAQARVGEPETAQKTQEEQLSLF